MAIHQGLRQMDKIKEIIKTTNEGLSPFLIGMWRSIFGVILQMMVMAYFMPEKLYIVFPFEWPLTSMTFLILTISAGGILTSGYVFTLFLELVILIPIWVIKRLFFQSSPTLEAEK